MQLSIVVPSYNEEENIALFYETVAPILDGLAYEWEIVFVNDGSSDNTVLEVKTLSEKDARVRLLSLSRNFGSYSALSAGFLYANGDAIVAISCDLQDPPELIADFVGAWENGADIVWGVRQSRTDPGLKSFYANTFYWLVRRFIWPSFPRGGFDFGLFDKRIIHLYNRLHPRSTIPFFIMYDMGFRQEQIPYHRRDRMYGTSGWGLLKRVKTAVDVFAYFSYAPVRFASTVGIVMSAISFALALVITLNRLIFGIGESGWPSIIVITTLIGGIQLTVLGVLGEYVWRIAEQVRERPRFLLQEQVGFDDKLDTGQGVERLFPHSHTKPQDTAAPGN